MVLRRCGGSVLVVLFLFQQVAPCLAQQDMAAPDYKIGVGDVLQLSVLQLPDLDGSLNVRPDGTVAISRIGAVAVAGLTVAEAEMIIRQRLQLYDSDISDVSVSMTDFSSQGIYVLGAVQLPGSLVFTTAPTLWEGVRAAGGPTPDARLSDVRLIRRQNGTTHMYSYDLTAVLTGQGALPEVLLGPGDTVILLAGEPQAQVPAAIGVEVIGNVANPRTVHINEPTRLLTVLMLAGSPLVDSKLDKVWWVHREGDNKFSANKVNMDLYFQDGSLAGNPLIYPGDSIQVPARQIGQTMATVGLILGLTLTVTTIFLTIDRIRN